MAIVTARLSLADNGLRMTLEEFEEAEFEEGYRYELARGVLEVTEVPADEHGDVIWNLNLFVTDYHRGRPGLILRAGEANGFRLWLPAMISGRNPDYAIVVAGTRRDKRGRRRPSIAFEVVSEGSEAIERDYVTKREEYLRYGLLEYWILDRFARKVTVLTRDGDAWDERVFVDGQSAEGLVLPGLAVPVADLWVVPAEDAEEQGE